MPSLDAFDAAETGDVDYTHRYLSAGNSPDAINFRGFSALQIAIEHSRPEIVRLLLAAGANPNLIDRFGTTPISRAIDAAREDADDRDAEPSFELVEMLLQHGADVYLAGPNGHSAIQSANDWKHPLLVQLLLKYLGPESLVVTQPRPSRFVRLVAAILTLLPARRR